MDNTKRTNGVDYLARLERFRHIDEEREELIKDLVTKYQNLEQRFEQKCKDYEDEAQTRGLYQAQANKMNTELIAVQHKMEVNSFIFAIIDGDGAVFREDWITKGEEGGAIAAHQLRTDIKKHVKDIYPDVNVEPWNVCVQVVLNLDGLSRKLSSIGFIKNTNELQAFTRGFSRAQGLFSIIDVGHGKEQADYKVREMLRLMANNLQCKHIIFGPCHDKGYIVELRPYQLEPTVSYRLSLLETTLAPYDFKELLFRRVKFADVFRSEFLPGSPIASSAPLPSTKTPNGSSFASMLRTPTPSPSPLASRPKSLAGTPEKTKTRKYYLVNSVGQRVDEPLPQADEASIQRFNERRSKERPGTGPCNRFHLNGLCDEGECSYFHAPRLGLGEQLIVRIKARGSFCHNKGDCMLADCYWGHQCKYESYGKICQRRDACTFAETHGTDLVPAEKVYEDGSREPLTV
ncbi:hypothetical protein F5Y04DRAFT_257721 [Hypomontagnella monticulosa]|nr:hypothetical protein F5Y04DRAFT_257721 [Hypomontagnella monticulosa]